jgi:hypothetical protein
MKTDIKIATGIRNPRTRIFADQGEALPMAGFPLSVSDFPDSGTFGFGGFCLDVFRSDGYKNGYKMMISGSLS